MTAAVLLAAVLAAGEGSGLVTWRLESETVEADRGAPAGPLPVGSLVKPFLAEAWMRTHPGEATPRSLCDRHSGCWQPSGHGSLGLARALALSCNVYFKRMVADTPAPALEATLRDSGFRVTVPLTPESALGLTEGQPTIEPAALVRAYARLVRTPWVEGEAVRSELVLGLREGACLGTVRLAGAVMGKTGTVPSLRGLPLRTSGWALVIERGGNVILGFLPDGTGRETAAALGGARPPSARRSESAAPSGARVRIRLLEALRPRTVFARNEGAAPVLTSRGFVGPGAEVGLRPGDRLDDGLWELRLPGSAFRRQLRGGLEVGPDRAGTLQVRADVSRQEYVGGVLRAELPDGVPEGRGELGAAVLRFLARGGRHDDADVCDRTHCAWFVGRGPRVLWPTPARPVLFRADPTEGIDPASWAGMLARAREPGPHFWTSHCGGAPLSAHFVWGNGDHRVFPCSRHATGTPWSREWKDTFLARAFGGPVRSLGVEALDGQWSLVVLVDGHHERLRFDDARRRVAEVMGGQALPSPAARVSRVTDGFRVEGVGHGHRVGFCLAN
jgi:hypothetical protein